MPSRTIGEMIAGGQIVHITPDASIYQACELMVERSVGAILVMEQGRLHGILSERDVVHGLVVPRADPDQTSVQSLMTPDPQTAPPETPAVDALVTMQDAGFRHLPVVSVEGEVYGMVTLGDFLAPEVATAEQEAASGMQVYESPSV
ncbi:MAG: CBS domain-containing protein [Rhodovibrionaceae bacterium]|nr:CBS domain-containing protein [Rhodovibrionaceae bacterium]